MNSGELIVLAGVLGGEIGDKGIGGGVMGSGVFCNLTDGMIDVDDLMGDLSWLTGDLSCVGDNLLGDLS